MVVAEPRVADPGGTREESGSAIGRGTFWIVFALGWLTLGALAIWGEVAQGRDIGYSLKGAMSALGPPAALAAIVAWRRRDLLRPDWPVPRMLALHVGIAVLYAVGAAVASGVIESSLGMYAELEELPMTPGQILVFRSVFGLLLYAVLAGFLMWTESLVRVQEVRAVAARESTLRAQAELKAIRAQFNPHFVFNTLHSLLLLVRAEPDAAERAIEDVGELIRYASVLQRRDVDSVPFGKELEIARRYVALEQLRLAERLNVVWQVEPGLAGLAIPPFSLQSLLENAIRHGISPRPAGGTVTVSAESRGGSLVVGVADDGEGAQAQDVARAAGHGIDLLARRLEALYGLSGTLEYETAPGRGFGVTVRVPARPAPAAIAGDGHDTRSHASLRSVVPSQADP